MSFFGRIAVLLWFVLSLFVAGVFAWSMKILHDQKKAWQTYAKKAGLNYERGRMSESPVVTGIMRGRKISLFSAPQTLRSARNQRLVTVIELEMGQGMKTAAGIATREYSEFISPLKLEETLEVQGQEWDKSYIIKTRDKRVLGEYLTAGRQKILHSVFTMKGAMAMFLFDEHEAVLRIETADPLRDPERIERIIQRLMAAMDGLQMTPEEKNKNLPTVASPAPEAQG